MSRENLISIAQAAKILGISRIAVYKKVKKGEIEAVRIGRSYAVDRRSLGPVFQETTEEARERIDEAVDRAVQEYGETLQRLGSE